ncbi:hypothetical protein [Actinoplanes sp. NPDC051494]|uniref:hypothetical protein n=1 Tax=Actinoplanes sp. NPDC051494 TaxID=3363907 RepID=UPI0037A5EED2
MRGEDLAGLARTIVSADAAEREAGAEHASDWARFFDDQEAGTVYRLLALMASIEPSDRAREAQLHAIGEISGWSVPDAAAIAPLFRRPPEGLDDQDRDYLAELGVLPPGDDD